MLVAIYGPAISILNAFLFIGLDLTCRDALHDAWQRRGLWWKMALLIAIGSLLSWALSLLFTPGFSDQARKIAFASFVAFAAASSLDALCYSLLHGQRWFVRANGSNVAGAAVDSLVFPMLAFGAWMPVVVIGQFAAKVLGGLVWSLILRRAKP